MWGEGVFEVLLADEKHINRAQVEVVEERRGSETIVGRMLAGIELLNKQENQHWYLGSSFWYIWYRQNSSTYHDGLALY